MRAALVGMVLGFVGIHLVGAGTAHADCAAPNATIAPHDGASLPADPTLYVFVPSYYADKVAADVKVRSAGKALAFETSVVSKTDAFWTFRIDVETGGATSIEVEYDARTATYAIDAKWARPAKPFVKVHGAEYVHDVWTCSHTDAFFLTLSDAPAYRVELGTGETVVFPHHNDDFWLWGDRKPATGNGLIGVGHLNCMGESADSGYGITSRSLRITPLYPDGSSGREWEQPITVDQNGVIAALRRLTAPEPEPGPAPASHRRLAAPSPAFDGLPLLGLAAFVLGFALARARLRRAAEVTRERVAALARYSVPQILCAVTATGAVWLALHAATAADAGATVGFSVAATTWAAIAGGAAALSSRLI